MDQLSGTPLWLHDIIDMAKERSEGGCLNGDQSVKAAPYVDIVCYGGDVSAEYGCQFRKLMLCVCQAVGTLISETVWRVPEAIGRTAEGLIRVVFFVSEQSDTLVEGARLLCRQPWPCT